MTGLDPMAPHWFASALYRELVGPARDRHPFGPPRMHYGSDLAPDSCARRTYYSLRFQPEPQAVELLVRAEVGNLVERRALEAISHAGHLVASQVRVRPMRPSAWCWEGTADALVRDPSGRLEVWEIKSVEAEIAHTLHKMGSVEMVRRERHLFQLGAYVSGLKEKFGPDLGHKLVFLPIGDGPVVVLEPPLPSLDEIVQRERDLECLVPGYAHSTDQPVPERLPLVSTPRKKVKLEASAACRWCQYAGRCEISDVAAKANAELDLRRAADEFMGGVGEAVAAAAENPLLGVGVAMPPATDLRPAGFGAWDFEDKPSAAVYESSGGAVHAAPARTLVLEAPAAREVTEDDPMQMPKTDDQKRVEELCDLESGLSPWEVEFADSVGRQVLDEGRTLTTRQREIVDRILTEKGR